MYMNSCKSKKDDELKMTSKKMKNQLRVHQTC